MFNTLIRNKSLPVDTAPLMIRYALPADADALGELAEIDSSRPPRGAVLVAWVGEELWAALSLDDGHAISDPFRPAAETLGMLTERARQVRRSQRGRMQGLPRVWPVGA
jgi:hypothetical protein